jgi:hypothetical protein
MKRLALLAAIVLAGSSCQLAHEHPAVSAGIAAGFIGMVPCLPAVSETKTCVEIGAAAGLGIGAIVYLVNLFADTSAHDVPPDPQFDPDMTRLRTTTPPPPGPMPEAPANVGTADAGVPAADAPVDSTPAD